MPADVTEAVRLLKDATMSAAIDPTTGLIDMDMLTTGHSGKDRDRSDLLSTKIKAVRRELVADFSFFANSQYVLA